MSNNEPLAAAPERKCGICKQRLNTRVFWDNIGVHKDCLDLLISQVRSPVTPSESQR